MGSRSPDSKTTRPVASVTVTCSQTTRSASKPVGTLWPSVPFLNSTRNAMPPSSARFDDHFAELISRPQELQPLVGELVQQIEVVANDVGGVVAVVGLDPARGKA